MKRPMFPPKPPAPSILPILGPAVSRARRFKPNQLSPTNSEVVEDIGRKISLPQSLLEEMRRAAKRRDDQAKE